MSIRLTTRINELGLVLPPAPKPVGVYRPSLCKVAIIDLMESQKKITDKGGTMRLGAWD